MLRTSTKPTRSKAGTMPVAPAPPPAPVAVGEVLTLAESAAYLRVTEAELLKMIGASEFPGRRVGDEWRFLKPALQDWLRGPIPKPTKEAVLALAGAWKDDPYLDEMLRDIYKKRGRPMTEKDE